ncbi:16067_t:CDS:2, partial [Dentiscutata erythropus]
DDIGSNYFISSSLKRGAKENTNSKENFNIITVVMNAIENLYSLIDYDCHYYKIEFLALIEQPFKLLLSNYSNYNDVFIGEKYLHQITITPDTDMSDIDLYILCTLKTTIFP